MDTLSLLAKALLYNFIVIIVLNGLDITKFIIVRKNMKSKDIDCSSFMFGEGTLGFLNTIIWLINRVFGCLSGVFISYFLFMKKFKKR